MKQINFELAPAPPFRLDMTVWALRRQATNTVDRWDGETYRRVLVLDKQPVQISVTQKGPPESPMLQVAVAGLVGQSGAAPAVTSVLEHLLGIRIDLKDFYEFAHQDSRLEPIAEQFKGVKPPRFPTLFEALLNGIICQQFSLTAGINLLNRLADSYGHPFEDKDAVAHAFPEPSSLAVLNPGDLRKFGMSLMKARASIEAGHTIADGRLDLNELSSLQNGAAVARLCQLHGVGRWTAEYTLLRGLGRLNIFPGDDVGARNNLQKWLGLGKPLDYEEVNRTLAEWKPFAGFIYFHLLLKHLAEEGIIS
jgi:DNA-3-methyladenine glycosylase II